MIKTTWVLDRFIKRPRLRRFDDSSAFSPSDNPFERTTQLQTRKAQGSITMAFIFATTKKSLNIHLPLSFQPLLPLLLQLNRVPKGSHCWPRGELSANESFWPVWNMFLFYQTQNQAQHMTLLCNSKWIEYFVDMIYVSLKFRSRMLINFLFSGTYWSNWISIIIKV